MNKVQIPQGFVEKFEAIPKVVIEQCRSTVSLGPTYHLTDDERGKPRYRLSRTDEIGDPLHYYRYYVCHCDGNSDAFLNIHSEEDSTNEQQWEAKAVTLGMQGSLFAWSEVLPVWNIA
jgi:hypothetical protein